MSTPTILVVGGTGQQGGATITSLLANNHKVRTISRNVDAPAAKSLSSKGVSVFSASLTDRPALITALQGTDYAFLMTDNKSNGAEHEVEQGKIFIDSAKEAGVKYIVFTSVSSADRNTGIPHFDSKYKVEQYLRESGLEWSILRPVGFMENIPLSGVGRAMTLGLFGAALGTEKTIQLIAVEDIGLTGAKALMHPEEFKGKVIDLVGDELNVAGIKKAFENAQGSSPFAVPLPWFLASKMLPLDYGIMFQWFRDVGYNANIAEVKKILPEVKTLEQWIRSKQ